MENKGHTPAISLEHWLQGTVHMDRVFGEARRSFALDVTGASFDECLHRASMDAAAAAVRAFLARDETVEAAAKAHCDHFGGEGWWETGLLADTLPEGRKAMRAALSRATEGEA